MGCCKFFLLLKAYRGTFVSELELVKNGPAPQHLISLCVLVVDLSVNSLLAGNTGFLIEFETYGSLTLFFIAPGKTTLRRRGVGAEIVHYGSTK